jgi:hypothetical protein
MDFYPLAKLLVVKTQVKTMRQFCDHFESPLHRILETFRASDALFAPSQPFGRTSVFMESLVI